MKCRLVQGSDTAAIKETCTLTLNLQSSLTAHSPCFAPKSVPQASTSAPLAPTFACQPPNLAPPSPTLALALAPDPALPPQTSDTLAHMFQTS